MIIGFSGSGKSTLARKIAGILDITPTHVDTINWKSGWIENDKQIQIQTLQKVIDSNEWVIDGNYHSILYKERICLADTIIFMDFNRFTCLYQVICRRIQYHNRTRPDMAQGCNEKLDFEFAKWVLHDGRKNRKKIQMKLSQIHDKNIYTFHTKKQVELFLKEIRRKYNESSNELVQ